MSKIAIFILSLLLSGSCFAQKPKPDKKNNTETSSQTDYSGVYEGVLDYSACCGSYDSAFGWIAFDMESSPPVILYDGVFNNYITIIGNKLVDNSEYSDYPNKDLGYFGISNGIPGIWYNNIGIIDTDTPVKVFLQKTNDLSAAREIITKYKAEKENWESFFENFKKSILNKDYNYVSSLCYSFPINESSCKTSDLTDEVYNDKELVKRLKIILNDVNSEENIHFFRFEDHHPMGGGRYEVNCGAQFQFMEINGGYRLIGIFCYG